MPAIAGNRAVAEVAATFARHFIEAQNPMQAILPLRAAMERLREGTATSASVVTTIFTQFAENFSSIRSHPRRVMGSA